MSTKRVLVAYAPRHAPTSTPEHNAWRSDPVTVRRVESPYAENRPSLDCGLPRSP